MKKILVIAAHSDDEALGCAGTMTKHIADGDSVYVLFMTNGVGARKTNERNTHERKKIAEKACALIGVKAMENFNFPDNKMDSIPLLNIIQVVEEKIRSIQPEIIYTHHIGDLNIDHQITHKAVLTACRPEPKFCVEAIYTFEVLSSTEWQEPEKNPFHPNVFVNISEHIEMKRAILEIYSDEMRKEPHSRSIENAIRLNAVRGNSVGVEFAEAFMLVREIK